MRECGRRQQPPPWGLMCVGEGRQGGAPHEHAGNDELELADVVLEAQAPRRVRVEAEVHHHTLRGRWGVREVERPELLERRRHWRAGGSGRNRPGVTRGNQPAQLCCRS